MYKFQFNFEYVHGLNILTSRSILKISIFTGVYIIIFERTLYRRKAVRLRGSRMYETFHGVFKFIQTQHCSHPSKTLHLPSMFEDIPSNFDASNAQKNSTWW